MPTTTEDLIEIVNSGHKKIEAALSKSAETNQEMQGRLMCLEQRIAGMSRGVGPRNAPTWGSRVSNHDRLKAFKADGLRGSCRIPIENALATPSGVEQRDLVAPQRDGIQGLGQQRLTVRDLIRSTPTNSNLIEYVRQTSRTINAAPVADADEKPESDLGFELAEAPVRTIAHWVPCPRQTLDDVDGLSSLIDGELRFGLKLVEEEQLLFGDGTGQNLLGIVPQATTYDLGSEPAATNGLDRILWGIVKAQQSRLPVDALLVNDITWAQLISAKDSTGAYLAGTGGGPFGSSVPGLLWQVRVLPTPSLDRGECLVGAFGLGARLHDRLETEVLISTEDRDNFIKNMVTIRAEERTALSVRVPNAFVFIEELGEGFSG